MAHHNDQTGLEQTLTERLAALPVPIRIVHHKPEHGAWYQWKTLLTGTGDCGTFADAVIQAITYQQEHEMQQALIATPARYTLETAATLGECLRRTRKVRPTPVLYLYLGAASAGWRVWTPMISSSKAGRWSCHGTPTSRTDTGQIQPGSTCSDRTGRVPWL